MKLKFLFLFLIITQVSFAQLNSDVVEIDRNGYTISYPSDLRLDTSKKVIEFYLFTEKTSPEDPLIENINLIIQNLKGLNIDLDKFVEITTKQIEEKGKIVESQRVKSGKNEFHLFLCERTFGNLQLKQLQYDFVKNDVAYVLTFTATKDEYLHYLPVMKKIMDSFKIKD